MKLISSRDNPTYKLALKLTRRKYRDETGTYLLEGVKPLEDAISAGMDIEQIFVAEGTGEHNLPEGSTVILERNLFAELSDTRSSQGVIAMVRQQSSEPGRIMKLASGDGGMLVLDRIQDPGNMGTMIRTAEAAAMAGVVLIKGCVDPYSPKVVRAAAGSLFRVPIVQKVETEELLDTARKTGRRVAVTALEGASDYRDAGLGGRDMIVIGNEGQGVSESFIEASDLKIKIPMAGSIESLNAAVAAGILMYESQR
ncbi:MAG: RNA methyltransferase [Firmicutes bacterium]|nr:RNA methyltransferase [Bacillota bacterium]MDD7015559.1 RNA methyltransferase [Bacillota bacterium]